MTFNGYSGVYSVKVQFDMQLKQLLALPILKNRHMNVIDVNTDQS